MIFTESRNNGFVMLRRNLVCHVEDGRMTMNEFAVFTMLLLLADSRSGKTLSCATALRTIFRCGRETKERDMRHTLDRLEKGGYVRRVRVAGKRGLYEIHINKYPITVGPSAGEMSQISSPNGEIERLDTVGDTALRTPGDRRDTDPDERRDERREGKSATSLESIGSKALTTVERRDDRPDERPDTAVISPVERLDTVGDAAPIQELHPNLRRDNDKRLPGRVREPLTSKAGECPVKDIYMNKGSKSSKSSKSSKDYSQLSPSGKLAWDYCVFMKEPTRYSNPVTQRLWASKFESLIAKHGFEQVKGLIHFVWTVPNFWQGKMYRERQDPVDYLIEKYAKIEDVYLPWLHNQSLTAGPAHEERQVPTSLSYTPNVVNPEEFEARLAKRLADREKWRLKEAARQLAQGKAPSPVTQNNKEIRL